MGRQTIDGRHEGVVAHVFADGSYGSSWGGGPVATHTADGTLLDIADQPVHSYAEVVGWRAFCSDPGDYRGDEHWRGPLWHRVATLAEQDLDARRIYCGDEMLDEESEDLISVDWEIHVGASAELHLVDIAHDQVVDAQRKLTEAVRTARDAGASWTDIGRAVGISRQSAHERWAKTTGQATR
ncbi:AsnC family protein [Nocardia carnea]|uniref:AsnC family protein n=1 Tax=Nocardia carnea TaxID=37328 RepID=UPI002457E85D|nr:AsnC family protein [Nocardia carnea]